MDTKWKNRLIISTLSLLLTFGLSGLLSLFTFGDRNYQHDYFHTPDFQSELDQFAGYLSLFELNSITLDEAKKKVKVSNDEIDAYRYQYGGLTEQIDNINAQYEGRIQAAMDENNQEAANSIKAERDSKIKDITNNFKSDVYVKQKIIKEKEQKIEDYYKDREKNRWNYLRYKEAIRYYFRNTETGKVYTNLSEDEITSSHLINPKNMAYITNFTITRDFAVNSIPEYGELVESILPASSGTFEGQIAVPNSLSSFLRTENNHYRQNRIILLVYLLASILSTTLFLYFIKKTKVFTTETDKWKPKYNLLPIDLRAFFFIGTSIAALIFLFLINDQILFLLDENQNGIGYIRNIIIYLIMSSAFIWLTLVQGKLLSLSLKDWENAKGEWKKGILSIANQKIKRFFSHAFDSVKEVFLEKSTGTQLIILLLIVFGLGFAAIMITIKPVFILLYLFLLGVIGLPILTMIIKKAGYFNRIVEKTSELAAGNLGQDLVVSGKTSLATLASNINVLKQGVKKSLNEQIKSERLKTELITNVSHDLRTPLTSIITYTELLKKEEISNEERAAYLDIIDSKSKRLKVLIEDLFEVSKMASGNIELAKAKVDLVQLLQQALAEYDDKINESSLLFRVTKTEKPIYAFVDGQKIWRVFENLIGNILKYSLENTRVYISVSKVNKQAMVTFKNVSKYELSENSEELFERFKRGDKSRHTEGSGLGLAIAKSIIDLHEGRLEIETDGDLFKVCIILMLEE